ncbi:MAG: AraC family transcriptional regulator [Methylomicrobium sp.]|nr:AraC family transcriptional regulator [Methylomicrobium sp.]
MDIMSDICRSLRLEGSVFFRSDLSAPWGIELPAAHEPRFHIVLAGHLWFQTEKMPQPQKMEAGDILIIPEGEWHWIADQTGRTMTPSADAGAALRQGRPMFQGNHPTTRLLCGLFRFDPDSPHPLIESLPPIIHLQGSDSVESRFLMHTAHWLFDEYDCANPGSTILMDRLCEIFFIQAFRYINKFEDLETGFLAALKDPKIHKALQCIHEQPSKPWTLKLLAGESAMSRAVFAQRFHESVGYSPIAYLTHWRMQRALNLLKDTNMAVSSIATTVGYASDAAFARAFQRHFKKTPGDYRKSAGLVA